MKLVLHNENDEIIDIFEDLRMVEFDEESNSMFWKDGSLENIKPNYTLLYESDPFNFEIGDSIDKATKDLDRSSERMQVDLKEEVKKINKENDDLRKKIEDMSGNSPVNLM